MSGSIVFVAFLFKFKDALFAWDDGELIFCFDVIKFAKGGDKANLFVVVVVAVVCNVGVVKLTLKWFNLVPFVLLLDVDVDVSTDILFMSIFFLLKWVWVMSIEKIKNLIFECFVFLINFSSSKIY